MARLTATIRSAALRLNTRVEIIFPQTPNPDYKKLPAQSANLKILYLLHGMMGNSSCWVNNTRLNYYVNSAQSYVVIMPEVQNSFYSDMVFGADYFSYVAYELPRIIEEMFNVKHTPQNTFIAGLSMGGYGALRIALSRPDFYAACASFSGALDVQFLLSRLSEMDEWNNRLTISILGTEKVLPENGNLFTLAENLAHKVEKPRVLITCGTEDTALIEGNRAFSAYLEKLPFPHAYKEWAGLHDWNFWEECLPVMFNYFNLEGDFA